MIGRDVRSGPRRGRAPCCSWTTCWPMPRCARRGVGRRHHRLPSRRGGIRRAHGRAAGLSRRSRPGVPADDLALGAARGTSSWRSATTGSRGSSCASSGQLGASPEVTGDGSDIVLPARLRDALRAAGDDAVVLVSALVHREVESKLPTHARHLSAHWRFAQGTLDRLRAELRLRPRREARGAR